MKKTAAQAATPFPTVLRPRDVVPRSIPDARAALAVMKRDIDAERTYEAIRKIERMAEAMRILFNEVEDVRREAEAIVVLANHRIGAELRAWPVSKGGRPSKTGPHGVPVSAPTLKQQVGSKNRGIGLKKLAAIPKAMVKATITKIQASGKEATVSAVIKAVDGDGKAERRAGRERELAEATRAASEVLGSKLYPVIMADPPWRFEPYSRETGMDRAADNHYPTMTRTDIGALKVPAADDCVLFLWATPAMNAEALAVMAEWGFAYKSQLVWAKDRTGTGYWARQQHELLLIGTKGDVPAPAPGQQPSSLISAPVGPHSAKPAVFHEIIEHMFPTAARLEMFARAGRPGWDSHGNEAPPAPVVGRGAAILPLIIGRGRGVISHPGADAEIRPPRRDCARRRAHENAPTFGCC